MVEAHVVGLLLACAAGAVVGQGAVQLDGQAPPSFAPFLGNPDHPLMPPANSYHPFNIMGSAQMGIFNSPFALNAMLPNPVAISAALNTASPLGWAQAPAKPLHPALMAMGHGSRPMAPQFPQFIPMGGAAGLSMPELPSVPSVPSIDVHSLAQTASGLGTSAESAMGTMSTAGAGAMRSAHKFFVPPYSWMWRLGMTGANVYRPETVGAIADVPELMNLVTGYYAGDPAAVEAARKAQDDGARDKFALANLAKMYPPPPSKRAAGMPEPPPTAAPLATPVVAAAAPPPAKPASPTPLPATSGGRGTADADADAEDDDLLARRRGPAGRGLEEEDAKAPTDREDQDADASDGHEAGMLDSMMGFLSPDSDVMSDPSHGHSKPAADHSKPAADHKPAKPAPKKPESASDDDDDDDADLAEVDKAQKADTNKALDDMYSAKDSAVAKLFSHTHEHNTPAHHETEKPQHTESPAKHAEAPAEKPKPQKALEEDDEDDESAAREEQKYLDDQPMASPFASFMPSMPSMMGMNLPNLHPAASSKAESQADGPAGLDYMALASTAMKAAKGEAGQADMLHAAEMAAPMMAQKMGLDPATAKMAQQGLSMFEKMGGASGGAAGGAGNGKMAQQMMDLAGPMMAKQMGVDPAMLKMAGPLLGNMM